MSVIYEAELATLLGPRVATNHQGFSGSGFADYVNPTGDYTEFIVEVDANGLYELSFRYALGANANRPLSLTIDGAVITTLDFSSTGNWANWNDLTEEVQLTAGTHAVRLTAIGMSGPNLDALTVNTLDTDEVSPGDTANGGAEPDEASPGDAVTGASNAFFSFEQWVSYTTIRQGQSYQSAIDFNVEIGGLRIAALFDETDYLSDNPDVAAVVKQGGLRYGFEHFVQFGINEGRSPANWFDEQYYLVQNADVAAAVSQGTVSSGLAHFLNIGHKENRNPSAFFDSSDYLLNNPDVQEAVAVGAFDSAFEHYIEYGAEEGRVNGLLFEESFYLRNNPDVAAAVQTGEVALGLYHFISVGQSEGRDPSKFFDQSAYLERYGDVAAAVAGGAFASGFEHYLLYGRAEGRTPL